VAERRLLAVLAHPDDESMGVGGVLAKYAAEGVRTAVVVATRGQRGRFHGRGPGDGHPGPVELGRIREKELTDAAAVLGVSDVALLDYEDQQLDRAEPVEAIDRIASEIRRLRPDVVVTFSPDGTYGHPDHIAISQLAAGAIAAAGAMDPRAGAHPPHLVSKFYYLVWSAPMLDAFDAAYHRLVSNVDGVERRVVPWPDWQITTVVDTSAHWQTVWKAVSCHRTQVTAYERLMHLPDESHATLWGRQSFYRVFSRVNGGRARESDLFEGIGNRRESDA
jgi:LmbE family N-acetylglucosaminyl deacetylase